MKQPKPRNSKIDMARFRIWTSTFSGYRHNVNEDRIDRWLKQFQNNHLDIAARILDCVDFVSSEQMTSAFRSILQGLEGWDNDKSKRIGRWRFCPFSGSAGESGDTMIHKFRHANRLSSRLYNELFIYRSDLLREGLTSDDTVVFIDDFSGSGQQACEAWKDTFEELLPESPKTYLVLVAANSKAKKKIESETELLVVSGIDYDERDNIFSSTCLHFNKSEKEIIFEYCKTVHRDKPKGHADCGLVVVFAHNCPNNSIPILHGTTKKWEGLFRRND